MEPLPTIAIDNSGGSDCPPVVFLHGFGGAAMQWRGLQTSTSFKTATLAIDLPGHGEAVDYAGAGPTGLAAKAVLATLEAHGISTAHIVGHSMGGAVASLAALMKPERFASLTLLAPGGYGTEFNHPLLMEWAGARTAEELRALLPQFFGPTYEVSEKIVAFQHHLRSRTGAVEMLTAIATGMSSDGQQGVLPVADILALPMPKTVLWGTADNVLPVLQLDQFEGHATTHLLTGVGHSPAEEATDQVKAAIFAQLAA
ncbi:alpha/beta fold hydrolase [Ahrensia sp. R2A130]|uniref:alpha/beta fold hydrolase n=1 Tax=Ahrensia sp. R2A130 TaxID=744979 RepID=UPI0001E0F8A0|nr:alpha/beta fold hydrolase [Ahrensia sp. R2A130]EFL89037.1 dihydrolipoamide S-acetyltransferase [Ahrensia sp. R2A130]